MKLKDIIQIIEKEYPPELAYEWDNSGLFFGDAEKNIKKVIVTLDLTPDIIKQAIELNVDMILAHHPVIMGGIKKLSGENMAVKMITAAIKNDIAIYSAHTNMDTAKNGINQKLAQLFELKNISVLEEDKPYENCGLGRIGELSEEVSLKEFCNIVKEKLQTSFVRCCGEDRAVKRVALASGSCSEYVPTALKKGADVIVTADMKYHNCIEYTYDGIAIIDAGHYPTEIIVCKMFSDLLADCDVEVVAAGSKDIFEVI